MDKKQIPQAETSEMDKHLITWRENGVDHQAVFYLPEGVNINDWVWDLLNYAEMHAEDYRLNYEVLP